MTLTTEEEKEETSPQPNCLPCSDAPASPESAVERLPPLLSYEEEGPMGRSPSLLSASHLTEREQLELVARAYRSSECDTESTTGDSSSESEEDERQKKDEDTGGEEGDEKNQLEKDSQHLSQQIPAVASQPRMPETKVGVTEEEHRGNDPSFVFLQLFHTAAPPSNPPLLLPSDEATARAIKLLDRIPPYTTHKIGVVYVCRGQMSETAILANTSGSSRYQHFLSGLGQLLRLSSCDPDLVYLGGLDRGGNDGEFTYFYLRDTTQVVFHVATLMPTLTSDPHCSNKKLHIGNDLVTIIFNESGAPYKFGTIKGQFGYVEVLVEPLPAGVNRVSVAVCGGMAGMISVEPVICSSSQLPTLVRTKALQANVHVPYLSLVDDCGLLNHVPLSP
ncbi:Tuberin [Geodia barretti]|uniref:Tuberin n=1 Tax=Geodia barretti TaxID=519541 RepID=A0AA35TCN0_GEOBA|nr:Tuberin [Geodia barretti]